ncbi:MAG: hypothetical protein EOO91_04800 [Pedobacter sp.]|nr:MAG: hypothetical protein EOO91_04800 [Pedobacter sp.]
MINREITSGLSASVFNSVEKAIESNQNETVYAFLSFIRTALRESINFRKLQYFQEYVGFPNRFYYHIFYLANKDKKYNIQVDLISEQLSLHLKEVIYEIGYRGKAVGSDAERMVINEFYYEAFNSFNDFLYQLTRHADWKIFSIAVGHFSNLYEGAFDLNFDEEYELTRLRRDNDNGANDEAIKHIRDRMHIAGEFAKYRRQITSGIKYWLILLFENNVIPSQHLNELLEEIRVDRYSPPNEINDVLWFRVANMRNYFGWERWDFENHKEGKAYYPPMPSNWMTKGFFIDRIRNANAFFNVDQVDPNLLQNVEYLYDSLRQIRQHIAANLEKWMLVLKVENIEEFNERADSLLLSVARAKRISIGERERIIANTPIDYERVASFTQSMLSFWKREARIRRIFEYFGNRRDVSAEEILLKRVGPNIFMSKAKMMFIDGPNHERIFGMDQIGSDVGRNEDALFVNVVFGNNPDTVEAATILDGLVIALKKLRDKNTVATVIFLEPEQIYKDDKFLSSKSYGQVYDGDIDTFGTQFFIIGTFEGIPLVTSYAFSLKDSFVVCDFANAFEMLYKTDENWAEGILSVKVKEISDELAHKKLNSEPAKWKKVEGEEALLSDEDAITMIKTSVVIDIETIIDFRVKDKEKYIVGVITEPIII